MRWIARSFAVLTIASRIVMSESAPGRWSAGPRNVSAPQSHAMVATLGRIGRGTSWPDSAVLPGASRTRQLASCRSSSVTLAASGWTR
jgi:hypothetical protein